MEKTTSFLNKASNDLNNAIKILDLELRQYNAWTATIFNNEIEALSNIKDRIDSTIEELEEWGNAKNNWEINK